MYTWKYLGMLPQYQWTPELLHFKCGMPYKTQKKCHCLLLGTQHIQHIYIYIYIPSNQIRHSKIWAADVHGDQTNTGAASQWALAPPSSLRYGKVGVFGMRLNHEPKTIEYLAWTISLLQGFFGEGLKSCWNYKRTSFKDVRWWYCWC